MITKLILAFISLAIILVGCNTTVEEIKTSDIKIFKIDKHPFLVDHKKKLVVELPDKSVNEILLYSDLGSGCNSHLFEDEKYFVLIDCNGQKCLIDKKIGTITKPEWTWQEPLPEKYICTYTRDIGDEYKRIQLKPTMKDVYKFKDPGDQ